MKRKRLSKKNEDFDHTLDESSEESNPLTTTTTPSSASATNLIDDPDPLTYDSTNSNGTNPESTLVSQASSITPIIVGRTLISKVWSYAKKSDDGRKALCLLCDFTCSCDDHSTSTIRRHLISKHNKTDLVKEPSSSTEVTVSEGLRKQLHQLCYYAIIKDSRPFSDFSKIGIKALFEKLCPGASLH